MTEVIVATSLNHSAVTRSYSFGDGISIRELPGIVWNPSTEAVISRDELDKIKNTKYWLCASACYEHVYGDVGNELFDKARAANWAIQIICPIGATNIFLKLQKNGSGFENIGLCKRNRLTSVVLGRVASLERQGLEKNFEAIYTGVYRAFTEEIVRLQNPILLIEHGLQIGNPNLGALMFAMGLDMLFMAGDADSFVKRVGGFLGLDAFIFPPDAIQGLQPNTTVRDVVEDVYRFRNIIAHGQEIQKTPWREKRGIVSTTGCPITYLPFRYRDVLMESSLFMLTAALHKVFFDNLVADVIDVTKWRSHMRLCESRYAVAGAPEVARNRER